MEEIHDFGETADLRQRIVDLGVAYGLVTDYTAMVVVREEVFAERGIGRSNRDRLALEEAARQQRAQQALVSRRVDAAQPMFSGNRASHNGGGALDAGWLLLLAPLAWYGWRRPTARGDA
jgi:Ca-activated chloride channel family protein